MMEGCSLFRSVDCARRHPNTNGRSSVVPVVVVRRTRSLDEREVMRRNQGKDARPRDRAPVGPVVMPSTSLRS